MDIPVLVGAISDCQAVFEYAKGIEKATCQVDMHRVDRNGDMTAKRAKTKRLDDVKKSQPKSVKRESEHLPFRRKYKTEMAIRCCKVNTVPLNHVRRPQYR